MLSQQCLREIAGGSLAISVARCLHCGKTWTAVHRPGLDALSCPACGRNCPVFRDENLYCADTALGKGLKALLAACAAFGVFGAALLLYGIHRTAGAAVASVVAGVGLLLGLTFCAYWAVRLFLLRIDMQADMERNSEYIGLGERDYYDEDEEEDDE